MTSYAEPTTFAWIITQDHLYESAKDTFSNETGITGPSEAPDNLVKHLKSDKNSEFFKRYTFRMYDDDGILYYTGRLISIQTEPDEEALAAPLYDFGGPGAGATLIKYEKHPEWTIEY